MNRHKNPKKTGPQNYRKSESQDLFLNSWSALDEYLRFKPKNIVKIECLEREVAKIKSKLDSAEISVPIELGDELKVFIKAYPKSEIELEIAVMESPDNVTYLALDHITDSRNLGAIIRSAAFFGINHIIVPNKRQASISNGTVLTCQGALALVDVYEVVNLSRTLKKLKDEGFWIIGADMQGEPIDAVAGRFNKNVIVMGSEDKGMSRNIQECCDVVTSIPGQGTLDSLNVSVAAGIILSKFSKSL